MAHRGHQVTVALGQPAQLGDLAGRGKHAAIVGRKTGHAHNRPVGLIVAMPGKGADFPYAVINQGDAKFLGDFANDGIAGGFARIDFPPGR